MVGASFVNQLYLAGFIRSRVEHRTDDEGNRRSSFSVLTAPYEKKEYVRVRARGRWAELCDGLKKGDYIRVIGPLITERTGGRTERVCCMEHLEILSRGSPAGRGDNAVPTKEKT